MTERPFSDRILQLAHKWKNNSITDAERHEFIGWYNSFNDAELVWPGDDGIKEELLTEIKGRIDTNKQIDIRGQIAVDPKPVIVMNRWKIVASIAAAVVIIALAINYFNVPGKPSNKTAAAKSFTPSPGTDKAILILGNGKEIELKGQSIIEDGENKIDNHNNELVYNNTTAFAYNTMITPRGGQYRLQLPDGSRVWLNAESKIIYPTVFTGRERKVQLEGEAYFEIERNKEKPFIVSSTNGTVQVLGTRFNINDYTDESFKATLLEGSVSVSAAGLSPAGGRVGGLTSREKGHILKPGQAYLKGNIIKVDTSEAIAWKNGYFTFNNADIQAVLRQLKRWYDLEIIYEGEVPDKYFIGDLPRNASLDQVLRILSKTGLHFKMDGRRMTVTR